MHLSVVIPNWNGLNFLETCLDALRAQTHTEIDVIIVDNASEDGSQDFIKTHYPDVMLIELSENTGFTGACNAGMEQAQGEIIALLNNDTEVDPDWAKEVCNAFERYPEIGAVASKMLLFNQRDHIHTAGDLFTKDGRAVNRGVWQKDEGQFEEEVFVFSACGGSSAYRKEMLDEIGLLDHDYFFLLEDIDLCWRAQLMGWKVLYVPTAIVYHHLSATGGGVTASYYDGRNSILLLAKVLPDELWQKYRGLIIRRQWRIAREALAAWRGEAARARLKGMCAGLLKVPKWRQKHRELMAKMRVTAAEIDEMLIEADEESLN